MQEFFNLVVAVSRAKKSVVHPVRPLSLARFKRQTFLNVNPQRRAQSGARVAGCRLHPNAVEQAAIAQASIHHTIEGYAAGQSQIAAAARFAEPAGDIEHRCFQGGL